MFLHIYCFISTWRFSAGISQNVFVHLRLLFVLHVNYQVFVSVRLRRFNFILFVAELTYFKNNESFVIRKCRIFCLNPETEKYFLRYRLPLLLNYLRILSGDTSLCYCWLISLSLFYNHQPGIAYHNNGGYICFCFSFWRIHR